MSFFKFKRRYTDGLWTKYIRLRDNYTCVKCGRVYSPDDCGNLGVSHLHGRGHENTRFDDQNTDALCTIPCHDYWGGEGRREYEDWKLEQLGQPAYDLLLLRSNVRKKRDDRADAIIIRALLKMIGE